MTKNENFTYFVEVIINFIIDLKLAKKLGITLLSSYKNAIIVYLYLAWLLPKYVFFIAILKIHIHTYFVMLMLNIRNMHYHISLANLIIKVMPELIYAYIFWDLGFANEISRFLIFFFCKFGEVILISIKKTRELIRLIRVRPYIRFVRISRWIRDI